MTASIDLAAIPELGLWVYLLAGLVLTAIMQSSSATIAIVLTMIFRGCIKTGKIYQVKPKYYECDKKFI